MPYPETAEGFMIHDTKKWTEFKKDEFPLKPFGDRDIDIAIDCCGVCASDVHTINGGWGEAPVPICVGHEVIGKAIKVGKDVKTIKVGDRVGVGAQIGADLTCNQCKADQENYCPNMVDTYGSNWPDGTKTQGGYSSHIRSHEYFTFKIPDALESENAAPMLCAGLTVYSPLVRLGCGPGKKVAISGVGGLGHYAVLFAKALGAEVYVLSHSADKEKAVREMGADHFININEKDWHKPYNFTFDFILNTADAVHKFNLPNYFSTLKVNGTFHCVGFGDHPLPTLNAQDFAPNGNYLGASHIGNRPEMLAMLDLAAKQNIKSWIEKVPISEAGIAKAVQGVSDNKVRFRYVLTDFDKAFGKRS
ncbi:NADPH-dependent medium chain alcohol dehydrogenase [Neohortaea acidophila]|uniref:NADPH-dependent medium chain alcohol dehydrogenase n=1 Tax=Neohortaea acidophila TaxID=245834 RepID=A0A6A6PGP7_9PEZI|nr:NADPH-dependent medium chain alcohol dehydrogenase [Neohortaea acidophila]KAF2479095.1 NADPH-dependent medium chain alcohol dehydrogenase [Neohortaea acidophila]